MTSPSRFAPAWRRTAVLSLSSLGLLPLAALADTLLPPPGPPLETTVTPPRPLDRPKAPARHKLAAPASTEPEEDSPGSGIASPFSKVAPAATSGGQSLVAPVTVNANTTADGLTVNQAGYGRALSATVSNAGNGVSALRGSTNGKGAGVNGLNTGTAGPAGKFEVTNTASGQPALVVTTTGSGQAITGLVSADNDSAAVYGQHVNADGTSGIGVQGVGGFMGVRGSGTYYGVYGATNGSYAVYGQNNGTGVGTVGFSTRGTGVEGWSGSGPGVVGRSDSLNANSYGVKGYSAHYAGVYGSSEVAIGTYGYSKSHFGIVGQSDTSYAGVFYGPVSVSGNLSARSVTYTSDRDQKQGFAPVDTADVLNRIAALPITAWNYKDRASERHIGPMAQDFHAAFGLGTDEKHIDVVDGVGVSLAAIQALQRQLEQRDAHTATQSARIADLEAQLRTLRETMESRMAAWERGAGPTAAALAQP